MTLDQFYLCDFLGVPYPASGLFAPSYFDHWPPTFAKHSAQNKTRIWDGRHSLIFGRTQAEWGNAEEKWPSIAKAARG